MKTLLAFLVALIVLAACTPNSINIDDQLTPELQRELMFDLSRYLCHLAPGASHETKFDPAFDNHYRTKAAELIPWFYHTDRSGKTYFLVCRIAPSIKVKYVATSGFFVRSPEGDGFSEYAEVFRTWKDEEPALKVKAEMLFTKLINQEDLTPYYTEHAGTEYIEFPDAETYYDTDRRVWVSTRENLLQEMKDEAARALKEAGDAVRQQRDSTSAE